MDDAALVEAARSGDPTAWGAIYDRYADKLHDHCHRILRDRDEAADALHDAFIAGARNLDQLRDPSRLRPWLYSICRHTSLRRLKARNRVDLTDAFDDVSGSDGDLDRGVRSEELSELVWAAAAGLSGRDQALLDLNLRQGLDGQDLADAMGTTLNNSYVMLSRLRDQVERSLGALLIARLGRDDCEELDDLLGDWDGRFSPLLRKRVARHVDGCEICSERRKAAVSPLALLAAAPLVPAPSYLKARVISSLRDIDAGGAAPGGRDPRGPGVPFNAVGFAAFDDAVERRRRGLLVAAIAALLLLVAGVSTAFSGGDDEPVQTAASESASTLDGQVSSSSTTSTTLSADATSTSGPDASSTSIGVTSTTKPKTVNPPAGGTTGGTVTTRPTTTSSRPSDGQGPSVTGISVIPADCARSGARAVRITAQVTDASPIGQVTTTISNGNLSYSTTMSKGQGSTYTATAGDFPEGGTIRWTIRATDESNNLTQRSGSISAVSCTTTTTTSTTTTTTVPPTSPGGPIGGGE